MTTTTTELPTQRDLYDRITPNPAIVLNRNDYHRLRWISGYQGEVTYEMPDGTRYFFRWAKLPWRWDFLTNGQRYWNWDRQEDFEKEMNGRHGLFVRGSEPADPEAFELFRKHFHQDAKTGWFDHATKQWVICEPTTANPSHDSWKALQAT